MDFSRWLGLFQRSKEVEILVPWCTWHVLFQREIWRGCSTLANLAWVIPERDLKEVEKFSTLADLACVIPERDLKSLKTSVPWRTWHGLLQREIWRVWKVQYLGGLGLGYSRERSEECIIPWCGMGYSREVEEVEKFSTLISGLRPVLF